MFIFQFLLWNFYVCTNIILGHQQQWFPFNCKFSKALENNELIQIYQIAGRGTFDSSFVGFNLDTALLCTIEIHSNNFALKSFYQQKKPKFVFQQNDGYMIIIGRHEEHQLYSLCLPLNTLICMRIHEHNVRIFETSIQCQHLIMANA